MQFGAFSISLAVKDLAASKAFYEKFGFTMFGGNGTNWAIMKNGDHIIGLQHFFGDKLKGRADAGSLNKLMIDN